MAHTTAERPPPDAARDHGGARRGWLTLLAIGLAAMVVQVDGTVVAIANPAIAADLGAGLSGISWVTTAYLLVLAGLMIPAGKVADRVGAKRALLVGIAGFSLASLACGLAGSIEVLVGARVVQGMFAAVLAPAGLAVLRTAFPPDRLGMAFGVFGAVSAVSLAGGPILGGVLVEYATWNWAFLINLPIGAIALAVGAAVIAPTPAQPGGSLDLLGAATLTGALVSLVWAVNGVPAHGWGDARTIGFLALAAVLLAAFVGVERRSSAPMVPLGLFADRTFTSGVVLVGVTMIAFFAVLFYLTFFVQGVQGAGPVAAAVAMLPLTVVFTVSSPLAGWLTARVGVRATLITGAATMVASLLLLVRLQPSSGAWDLAPSLVLAGFGVGFLMIPAMEASLGGVAVEHAGVASGIQQSAQQLGGTLGIAVFGTVLSSVISGRLAGAVAAAVGSSDVEIAEEAVAVGFPRGSQDALAAELAASGLPADRVRATVEAVTGAAHATFVDGLHTVFLVGAGLALVAGLVALLVRKPPVTSEPTPAP